MSTEYRLNNTGEEVQKRLDQVLPNSEAISQEQQDRENRDKELLAEIAETAKKVGEEQQRAEQAESDLQGSIDAEILRATNAEKALQELIGSTEGVGTESVAGLQSQINDIKDLIPTQANKQNQLADKDFVNSSIATSTAEYRGEYDSLEELLAVQADDNDYAYVRQKDEAGNEYYDRYKFVKGTGWKFEFKVNNTTFTEAQWKSINSNMTQEATNKLKDLPTANELNNEFSDVRKQISDIQGGENDSFASLKKKIEDETKAREEALVGYVKATGNTEAIDYPNDPYLSMIEQKGNEYGKKLEDSAKLFQNILDEKQQAAGTQEIDAYPTEKSGKVVSSGGVYEAIKKLCFSANTDSFSPGYYRMDTFVENETVLTQDIPLYGVNTAFRSKRLVLPAGSKIEISGLGHNQQPRLYCIINYHTGLVTEVAEKSLDTLNQPKEIILKEDSIIYVSFNDSNGYIGVVIDPTNFLLKAEFNNQPETVVFCSPVIRQIPILSTIETTFTIPKGAAVITKLGINAEIEKDIVFTKDISQYEVLILNVVTFETRVTRAAKISLARNENIIAFVKWDTGVIEGSFFEYYKDGELVTFKNTDNQQCVSSITSSITSPIMFNPKINIKKDNLKILDLGNSYTNNSLTYLKEIVESFNIDTSNMSIYKGIIGGGSFKNWFDAYNNKLEKTYFIEKVLGQTLISKDGSSDGTNGEKLRYLLENNEWDLILIHQCPEYAPYYDEFNGDGNGGYLKDFIRVLRKHQPNASIGTYLVHSHIGTYSGNAEKSSYGEWKLIAESVKQLHANYGIDFIIPYGTAIQNLRNTSLNNEHEFLYDGTHLAKGIACYTASCTYFQSIFAPRYNTSIFKNKFISVNVDDTNVTYPDTIINVTAENAIIAHKAAFLSCCDMYNVINPEEVEI